MPRYFFVRFSTNKKLGGMPAVYSDASTCPPSCPLMKRGCYAHAGGVNWVWRKVSTGIWGGAWRQLLAAVRTLPRQILWRYGVAGDLPGHGNRLNITQLRQLVKANRGKHGFLYTHKPLWRRAEREAVQQAVHDGLAINLSANTLAHADMLSDLGIAPVVVTVPNFTELPRTTPGGRFLTPCPEQTHGVPCAVCQLCAKPRHSIIAFAAHGAEKDAITW